METEKQSFEEIMSRIGKGLDTHTVFGEPEQVDGSVIIPVARISYGGGGGLGAGTGAEEPEASGEGMGMGFGVKAQPLGVVRVRAESVEWVPIIDRTRLLAIWSAVGGMLLIMALKSLSRR